VNPYGSVEVPDHVPDQWQRRYGGEHVRDDTEDPAEAEVRARAAVIRLLAWVGAVTTIGVVVMWPATHLPRFLAILAFVGLGTVAVLVFARWVLRATELG
jgi:hypothetical protein